MSVTPPPTDQPYGQILTDQKALETVFRAHYTRLVADAKKRLGDASASAPRIVSKAFHLAWQDRKRFHSMEELDAFLGAQIHHGAAREQSRLAGLHRMDSHTGAGPGTKEKHDVAEMSVDEAWERLKGTLQGGAPEAHRKRASTARHEAAEHVAQLAKKRSWKPFALVGVVALLVAAGGIWWIEKAGASREIDRALNAGDTRSYEMGNGQVANITLDDSTIVRIGPQSKLTVPKRYGMTGGFRAVKIEGTASFEVTRPGLVPPFEVRKGPVALIARGTKFVVRSYAEDSALIVNVREGSVELRRGDQMRTVGTGMSFLVTDSGAFRVPSAEELAEASSWADGTVNISGRTLRYVRPQMKRWFGLDVQVPDTKLLDRTVFLTAPLGSNAAAIASVEKSGGLKFTYIGQNMAFTDTVGTGTRTKAAPRRR